MRHILAGVALCAATLLAYANSFQAGFALDNQTLLLGDPRLREATSENVNLILQHTYWWPHSESSLYRPVATLSYLFNYAILGGASDPAGYHWINLLLHLANVLLAYAVLLRLTRHFWVSTWSAGLWALHPILTESVTNIVGRPDLLAAAAILSGLLMYWKAADTDGALRFAWLGGVLAVTTIGVFSKESAAVIPGVLALYEVCWGARRRRPVFLLGCAAVLLPVAAMWLQRSAVLAPVTPMPFPFADNPLAGASYFTARLTALKVMARYLGLLIWPAALSCDYSYAEIPLARGAYQDWISWAVVAALLAAAIVLYRRNRTAFFLAGFAFLAFLPASNLLFPIGTIMAERFLYLPSVGLIGSAALVLDASFPRLKTAAALPILSLMGCALGWRTFTRNADWGDNLSLASAAVKACPKSYKTHAMLASALFAADPDHNHLDRVIAEADLSLAVLDPLPDLHNVAQAYGQAGDYYLLTGDLLLDHGPGGELKPTAASNRAYQRSVRILERSIAIFEAYDRRNEEAARARGKPSGGAASPIYVDAYRALSTARLRLLQVGQSLDAAIHARALDPGNPAIYSQISDILRIQGRAGDAAIALLTGALFTSDPGLRQELMSLYRGGLDSRGCAVVSGPEGPALDPSCPMVHLDLCAAAAEIIRLHLAAGGPESAIQSRNQAVSEFGCPADPLDRILNSK